MLKLNPFAISGIFLTIFYLPIAVFIFLKGKTKIAKVYSYHLFCVAIWGISSILIALNNSPSNAMYLWRIAFTFVIFIPIFFYDAVALITKNKNKLLVRLFYVQGIISSCLVFLGWAHSGIEFDFNSFYYYRASTIGTLMVLCWIFTVWIAHFDLYVNYKKSEKKLRKQLYFLCLASIGFLAGLSNFLPGWNISVYPYGNFFIPIHACVVGYAIFKYQLLDIEIYKKGFVYSILLTSISIFYLLSVVCLEKLIQNSIGYRSPTSSIIIAFILGLLFIPLRNIIQNIVDVYFLKTSHIEVITENERLRQEITQTEKLKSIATFASGMAHEIKNPLTSIKIFCEYLPKKLHDNEFLNKFIPIVTRDADRINELVHDLLEYAKPSPPEVKPTDIHKLIETVLDTLSAQIVDKRIEILRDFDNRTIENISIDAKQIKQALLNILLNAVESIHLNGSLLIRTQFAPNENKIILKITDTGCGISPEDIPHIFDPFFTKKEQGTGLGLSITHGIIKEHGGKIFAESVLGRGTTFRIELPIKK
jgi:signal transduction histidine kinase